MPCHAILDANGNQIGWACGRGQRTKRCVQCGKPSTKLCDFPLSGAKSGSTCDRPLCDGCAVTVGRQGQDTIDYCRVHAERHARSQGAKP